MNKSIYIPNQLHPDREEKFQKDYNRFIEEIQNIESKTLNFETFKKYWKQAKMHFIHCALLKNEDPNEYYQTLYGIILKELLNSNLTVQFTAIYALYSIYSTQIKNERIKIRITPEYLDQLSKAFQYADEQDLIDVCATIRELIIQEAFIYCYNAGLSTILVDKHGEPLTSKILDFTVESSKRDLLQLLDLKDVEDAAKYYHELKLKFRQSKIIDLTTDKVVFDTESNQLVRESKKNLLLTDKTLIKKISNKIKHI